jgi:hypothetical protein
MKLRGLIPNFHHIHVSERFIYSHDFSTYFALQQTRWANWYIAFAVQVPGSTLDPTSGDSYSEVTKMIYNKQQQKITSKYKAYCMAP